MKNLLKNFSNSIFKFSKRNVSELTLPVIDAKKYINKSENWESECKLVAQCFHETGVLAVLDPRVKEDDNQVFIRQMEDYFYQISRKYYEGNISSDIRPDTHFQVGATPEFKEKARSHCERFSKYSNENKPVTECPPVYDSKWRFFWTIGERDPELDKGMLMYENVIPKEFPNWKNVMNTWGTYMHDACYLIAEMGAIGLGLNKDDFTSRMKYAGHLLAPTGSDLGKFKVNDIFAGVHYDLNFLTIHGKSNYGGLYIWLRNGEKRKVRIPDGCLLLQAGRQLEYLTGGDCLAGFHEVVYTDEVKKVVDKKIEENKSLGYDKHKLWRVSSTLFSQIRQNVILEPLGKFKNPSSVQKYPPILTRDQVAEELKSISLMV